MAYEGPDIFLTPYANDEALENFQNTVIEGVDADRVRAFADDPPARDGVVHLWGAKPSVSGTWEKVDDGDYLLFYRNDHYTHAAEIVRTEQNENLAREMWPNFEDDPWDRILYLAPPTEIRVPSEEIADLAGYDRTHVMGFSPLNDMGVGGIRGKYGSVEAFAEGKEPVSGSDGDQPDIDVLSTPDVDFSDDVLDGLYFPDRRGREILDQVASAYESGKHVIFTGPPGTGKTEIASRVAEELVEAESDVYTGFEITTATADWSTFETVGGYMPTETDGEDLSFESGQVLRRFKDDGVQQNELLVIDEINRADIDKAFGQLFTLLSGQEVQLPYRRGGEEIVVRPASKSEGPGGSHEYVMPESWRIFATMNTYDKTSLYELSYAFMRRFSFVHVDAPTIPDGEEGTELLGRYADEWGLDPDETVLDAVSDVWRRLNGAQDGRKIGPAIVQDMLLGIEHAPHTDLDGAITAAVGNYVLPQLEGTPHQERIVKALMNVDRIDARRIRELAADVLQVRIDA